MPAQTISITNFLGGLSPSRYVGDAQSQMDSQSKGWTGVDNINVLQRGINSSAAMTNVSIIAGDITWMKTVNLPAGAYTYCFEDNGVIAQPKIQRVDWSAGTPTITNAGSFPHTITNASPYNGVSGMELFTDASGNPLLYYANGVNLGTYDLNVTFNDTYRTNLGTTALGQTISHPMCQGQGKLFIGDSNSSATCVSTEDGSALTKAALNLSKFNVVVKDICFNRNFVYIACSSIPNRGNITGGSKRGVSKLILWDAVSSSPQEVFDFPEDDFTAIEPFNGKVYCWGVNGFYVFTGNGFQLLSGNLLLSMSSGHPSSVDISSDGMVYWRGSDENSSLAIYSYGSTDPRIPATFFKPIVPPAASQNTGMHFAAKGKLLLAGSSNSNNRLKYYNGTTGTYDATGVWRTPMIDFPNNARIARVKVDTLALPSGTSFDVIWAKDDGSSTTTIFTCNITGSTTQWGTVDGLVGGRWQVGINHTAGASPQIVQVRIDYSDEGD